MIGYDKKLR